MEFYYSDRAPPVFYVDDYTLDYNYQPSMDEIILNSLTEPYIDDINLHHLRESIFNKWSYVDNYSRSRINNYFLREYPEYWIHNLNNFNEPDYFIRSLLNDFPYSIRNSYDLVPEDIKFLILLDKYLSLKLDKKVKDECEKTKIKGITTRVWEFFNVQIKNNEEINFHMIDSFKALYSQYDKDTEYIGKIYDLLKKCYQKRRTSSKNFEIETLLGLFDGCDMNNFSDTIDKYENNKKYLLNRKYLEKNKKL